MQNAAAATGSGSVLDVASYATALFVLSGTYSATVTFEATLDGSTWFQWFAFNYAGTRGGTATATGVYLSPVVGMFQVRARISAYTSGSVTVRGKAIAESIDVYMFGQQEATQDGDQLDIDWNPTYYTPDATPAEADDVDDLSAHLYGIDQAFNGKASTAHKATHITAGSDEIDGDKLDIDWDPTNYTPSTSPTEADSADNLTAHLYGIDQEIGQNASDIATNTTNIAANAAAMLEKDGSVALTADWDIGDGRYIATDKIRARDGAGLLLQDDGGNGVFVEDGGNVGVGITTPDRNLHVHKASAGSVTAHANAVIVAENNTTAMMQILTPDGGTSYFAQGTPTDPLANYFAFIHNVSATANVLAVGIDGTSRFVFWTGGIYPLQDNAQSAGKSGNRFTEVWATNGTIQTSDDREKEEEEDSDRGLSFIRKLRPIKYRWKEGDGRTYYGLSAQQIKQVIDQEGKDFGGYVYDAETDAHALNYASFVAPLIAAVQELSTRIDALEARR